MSTPATLPQAVWTSKVLPAPKTSDALAQIAHFLEQLGYAKTVKALRKEAEANEATFTTTGWPNSADGPFARTLGDLYVDAFLEEFSDEESEKSDSDDSSSSDEAEQEMTQAAVSGTKRKREVSVSSESEDSDSSSAASSSSEDTDSDSDEDSDTEPAAKRTKIEDMTGKTLDSAGDLDSDDSSSDSESSESGDSSSASDSSESDDSSDTDDESEDADSEKASEEGSSDSDSDTSSDSSESEEEETVVAPVIPDKKSKKALLKQKSAKEDESASSASSATLIASPVPAETNAIESSMHPARQQRLDNDNRPALNKNGKGNVPFSRIPKDTQVDPRFASNEYVSYDYADRAYQDLVVTKGKGFTKEKNKKKRGSYRGGAIDIAPKGIKFDD